MRILVLLSALFLATVAAVRPQVNPGLKCKSDALCWESVGIKCPADSTCHTFKWATEGGLGRCYNDTPNCPSDEWLFFNGKCYLLNSEAQVSWFHAVEACYKIGARLADVRSAETEEFLRSKILKKHENDDPQKVGYWIAANDLANEGRYVWGFPSNDVVEYTDWFSGEPNNFYYDHRHEDCVSMWGHDNHDYLWNDEPCEIDEYYICQIKNGSPVLGKQ